MIKINTSFTNRKAMFIILYLKLIVFSQLQWGLSVLAQVQTTTPTGVCEQLMRHTIFSSVSLQLDSWNILI